MPRRIARRRILQVSAGAAAAAVAYGVLGVPGVRSRSDPSARRVLTKEFHLGPTELAEGSRAGLASSSVGLKVGSGHHAGHVLSPVLRSDLLFDYVGLFWSGLYPEDSSVAFRVRTSTDGRSWSPWETVHVEIPAGPRAQYDTYGALVWADRANYVQFLAEMRGAGKNPELHRVGLTLLNPYDGPILEAASEPGDGGFGSSALAAEADSDLEANVTLAAASGKPITFKREDWGADESLRFSSGLEIWPRSYVPTKKLIVHHTVTSNAYATSADARAQVRAIYTYHAKSLGWGDIGYNSLIDRFGNSYEGRRGRTGPGYDGPGGREILSEDVVAGHALAYNYGSSGIALLGTFCTPSECAGGSPTSAMISRLKDVLAWECLRHGLRPGAPADFLLHNGTWHRNLRNAVGHRDVSGTICPGGNVYALLPTLRSAVAARLADSAAPSVSITSAPSEGSVKSGEVDYTWTGSGGSGGLQYSYYLEGWSKVSGSSEVNYIQGFDSRKSPVWGAWTSGTKARFQYLAKGLYTFHVRVKDSSGRVGVYHETRTFLGVAPTSIPNGALLQASGTGIYVMRGGLKRGIRNPVTFEANGFNWGNVIRLSKSGLAAIPTGDPLLDAMADGNLLTASGFGAYVMEGGSRRLVKNTTVFSECGYGWGAVKGISSNRLRGIPRGADLTGPPCPQLLPPSGTLLQARGTAIYVMRGGLKRGIRNPVSFEANGFQWGNVNQLAKSTVTAIPTGDPLLDAMADGNLLTASGFGVYVMQGGLRRLVKNTTVFSECGYDWDAAQVIPSSRLSAIPRGTDLTGPPCPKLLPLDGALVQASGTAIYVMKGGVKRGIRNPVSFEAHGFQWGNVNILLRSVMTAIPTGEPLLDAMADGSLLTASGFGVYVMEGGLRRLVKNTTVFSECGYGWDAVQGIPSSRLSGIPRGPDVTGPPCPKLLPPDGSMLQGSTTDVYVMDGGKKRLIVGEEVFTGCGYLSANVNAVADSTLESILTGDDLIGEPCP